MRRRWATFSSHNTAEQPFTHRIPQLSTHRIQQPAPHRIQQPSEPQHNTAKQPFTHKIQQPSTQQKNSQGTFYSQNIATLNSTIQQSNLLLNRIQPRNFLLTEYSNLVLNNTAKQSSTQQNTAEQPSHSTEYSNLLPTEYHNLLLTEYSWATVYSTENSWATFYSTEYRWATFYSTEYRSKTLFRMQHKIIYVI